MINSKDNPVIFNLYFFKEIKSVGQLIEAIKDGEEGEFEDGNITKEIYQKIQFLKILILIFISFGSILCLLSVKAKII